MNISDLDIRPKIEPTPYYSVAEVSKFVQSGKNLFFHLQNVVVKNCVGVSYLRMIDWLCGCQIETNLEDLKEMSFPPIFLSGIFL